MKLLTSKPAARSCCHRRRRHPAPICRRPNALSSRLGKPSKINPGKTQCFVITLFTQRDNQLEEKKNELLLLCLCGDDRSRKYSLTARRI